MGSCPTEEDGVNLFQPCTSATKSIDDALCQTIDVNTLKPTEKGVGMDSYESYICCPGCVNVGLIVGLVVLLLVIVASAGVCIYKSKRKSVGMRVQPAPVMASAPPPTVPMPTSISIAPPQVVGY